MRDLIIKGYSEAATPEFISDYEAIPIADFYKDVLELFPQKPARIIDIGAGTGRDAAWLADLGHSVTAIEPTAKLLEAAKALHHQPNIVWIDDYLPELSKIPNQGEFDLILLSGVWQHIDEAEREIAMNRFSQIAAPNCRIIMALRHGKASKNRPVFDIDPKDTIKHANANGFRPIRQISGKSIRKQNIALGVTWTWLVLEKE